MAAGNSDWKNAKTIYEFSAKDIDENDVKLERYRGKVLLIVNVACKCGKFCILFHIVASFSTTMTMHFCG